MSFLTMPLAFDLTSTFVMGWTLPVATTLFAKSPWSTLAILVGSILVLLLVALVTTVPSTSSTTTVVPIHQIRCFFFLELPLATLFLHSCFGCRDFYDWCVSAKTSYATAPPKVPEVCRVLTLWPKAENTHLRPENSLKVSIRR